MVIGIPRDKTFTVVPNGPILIVLGVFTYVFIKTSTEFSLTKTVINHTVFSFLSPDMKLHNYLADARL